MTVSAGFLIYSGIMPLVKTFAALICGYILVKMDMFPPAASRGASIVAMNVALPALIFANIVPSFTPSNISALGPMFLIAIVYQLLGFLMGLIIREICYVPRNFWQGIVVMTGMSNWGNLPNAIVMSVTQLPPFNPISDPALGVSYVSIFTVCYHSVFWMCGAANSLAWDYLPGIPQGEEAERRVSWKEKPIGHLIARAFRLPVAPPPPLPSEAEKDEESISTRDSGRDTNEKSETIEFPAPTVTLPKIMISGQPVADLDVQLTRGASHLSTQAFRSRRPTVTIAIPPSPLRISTTAASSSMHVSVPSSPGFTTAPSTPTRLGMSPIRAVPPTTPIRSVHSIHSLEDPSSLATLEVRVPRKDRHWIVSMLLAFSALIKPVTVALVLALPIALILPLKALFVNCTAQGGPNWHGPDGRPPLAFVMDTAQFIDTIAVPLTLILLGASFARIQMPRPLSRLPIMAIMLVTLAKMVLLPVLGVIIVQGMVKGALIPKDAKAEKFVAMLLSGTPAAANQMIVASLYAPEGNVDTLSAFLFVQYMFMFVGSAALTAVALLLV